MTGRRFLALLAPHASRLVVAGVLLALTAAAPAVVVWLLHEAVGRLGGTDPGSVVPLALGLVGTTTLLGAGQVARTAVTRRVSGEVASDLRRALHAALLAEEEGGVGDRLQALLEEVDHVQYGVSAAVTVLRDPVSAALILGSAVWICPPLVPWAVVLLLPLGPAAAFAGRSVREAARVHRERRAELASLLAEQLAGVEVLRAFGAIGEERRLLRIADDAERGARLRLEVRRLLPSVTVNVLAASALAVLVGVGAGEIHAGRTDAAAVLAFLAALLLATRPLAGLSEASSLWSRASVALERVERAIASADGEPAAAPVPLSSAADVRWSSASIVREGRRVVDHAEAEARAGELTALVGPSGAGKTTLLRLAAGALDPDEGEVTIGGIPAGRARGAVGFVPQHPVLFSRSIARNVALGEAEPDPERVCEALRLAGAAHLDPQRIAVDAGRTLSGGERQRIGVARALYRGSTVLLLDEPTASLDAVTADALVDTLVALRAGRTVVVATHDERLWRRADARVAVRDGIVVAEVAWTAC